MFDQSNTATTNPLDAVKFVYKITYLSRRWSYFQKLPETSNPAVVATTFQEASAHLSGYYTFVINNEF